MMRNKPLILALAAALTSACTAAPLASPTEVNRAIIEDFARIFYSERDVRQAFEKHVAPDYIQHNPGIADGREAAIRALTPMFSRPEARFEVKRILVDGDLAAIHLLGRGDPATPGAAVADIYRLEDGKIVEHWDILQPMPTKSANPHPMF
jgi:predicted SnoaL-like aldol condensation-catalyzing enzyme